MSSRTLTDRLIDNLTIQSSIRLPPVVGLTTPKMATGGLVYFDTDTSSAKLSIETSGTEIVQIATTSSQSTTALQISSATEEITTLASTMSYTPTGATPTLTIYPPVTLINVTTPEDGTEVTFRLSSRYQAGVTISFARGALYMDASLPLVKVKWVNGENVITDSTSTGDAFVPTWQGATIHRSVVEGTATGQSTAVALSADGNLLLIGDAGIASPGRARVYRRTATTAFSLLQTLVATPVLGVAASQGAGVAIDRDGTRLFVADPTDNTDVGALWVWTLNTDTGLYALSDTTPSGVTGKIIPPTSGESSFGAIQAVAPNLLSVSADGRVLAVGSPSADATTGRITIWTRTGTVWVLGVELNEGSGANPQYGVPRLSSDGNYLFCGQRAGDGVQRVSTPLFGADGGTRWAGTSMIGSFTAPGGGSALTASTSDDLSRILITDGSGQVSLITMNFFSPQTAVATTYFTIGRLTPNIAIPAGYGRDIAISGDGRTIAVGSQDEAGGLVYLFRYGSAPIYASLPAGLAGTGTVAGDNMGFCLSLTHDGRTLACGVIETATNPDVFIFE